MTEHAEPKQTKRINLRIDAERMRAITRLAATEGLSVSEIARNAIDLVIHDSEPKTVDAHE